MKKIFVLTLLAVALSASVAFGATMQFTADNQVTYFGINDTVIIDTANGITSGDVSGNINTWTSLKTYSFDYDPTETYVFTWALSNVGGTSGSSSASNPMAFIAQIDLDGSGWDFTSNLEDGSGWSVLADEGDVYSTAYGSGAWNSRPSGVTSEAMWLGVTGATSMGVTLTVASQTSATPIPGAAWLLGSGLFGLVGLRRKFQ